MMRAVSIVTGLLLATSCSRRHTTPSEHSAIRWDGPVDVARGGGTRGEWRQNNSDYNYVDDTTVALADDGDTIAAWVDQRRKEVYVQRFAPNGSPRTSAIAVSRSPDVYSWLPRLALLGDHVFVLWQEIVFSGGTHGGEAFFARSSDGGATFEPPQNLSRSRNGDGKGRVDEVWHNGSLDLAAGRDGTLVAAWTEFDGPLWFTRSVDSGATFSPPVRIGHDTAARAPAVAIAGDTVYLAWSVGDDPTADLRLAISTNGGRTFAAPKLVANTPGYSDAPKLAVDQHDRLHLAWSESVDGPFDRALIRYARSTDRGRSFETTRTLSGSASAGFPMLALDGLNVAVSWELVTEPHQRSRGLALATSRDGGTTFSAPSLVAHSMDPRGGLNGSHQGRLMEKLALRDGRIVVANSALAHGATSRAWFVRGTLPGVSGPLRASASSSRDDR